MTKKKIRQENLSKQPDKVYLSGWDRAIADSQELIAEAKGQIKTLRRGIQHFTAMRQRGVSFPGEAKRTRNHVVNILLTSHERDHDPAARIHSSLAGPVKLRNTLPPLASNDLFHRWIRLSMADRFCPQLSLRLLQNRIGLASDAQPASGFS